MTKHSATIFDLLTYIYRNPNKVVFSKTNYCNVIQIFIPKNFDFQIDYQRYFQCNMLDSWCLYPTAQQKHQQLLENLWHKVTKASLKYNEIWLTTAYLTKQETYFIEISYEELLS